MAVWPAIDMLGGLTRDAFSLWLLKRKTKRVVEYAPDTHKHIWRYIEENQNFFSGRSRHSNRFQIPWRNFAFERLFRNFKPTQKDLLDLIKIHADPGSLNQANGAPGVLVLGIHARLAFAARAALTSNGHRVVLLSNIDNNAEDAANIGSKDNALLKIRQKIRTGQSVVAMTDFTSRRPGTLYHDHYLSNALIQFAQTTGIDLMFYVARVTKDGHVELDFFRHKPDGSRPYDTANAFLERLQNSTGQGADWTVVNSPAEVPRLTFQLNDFCLNPT